MDDKTVKRLQAEAMQKLEEDMARADAEARHDPTKAGRRAFGFELVHFRIKNKLTQTELADRAGLRQTTISRIEGGKANPSLKTLLKITKALEVNLMLE